jgi:hypothetical protein
MKFYINKDLFNYSRLINFMDNINNRVKILEILFKVAIILALQNIIQIQV